MDQTELYHLTRVIVTFVADKLSPFDRTLEHDGVDIVKQAIIGLGFAQSPSPILAAACVESTVMGRRSVQSSVLGHSRFSWISDLEAQSDKKGIMLRTWGYGRFLSRACVAICFLLLFPFSIVLCFVM